MVFNLKKQALLVFLFSLPSCSSFNLYTNQKVIIDPNSTQALYMECKQALKESVDDKMLGHSSCNQKISFFLGGALWGGLLAPVPKDIEANLFEENYKMNRRNFDCVQNKGYLVATNPEEHILLSRGVNLPATFVKWVEQEPDKRMKVGIGESLLSALLTPCSK